jgi:Mrp family chromosome partitioning ATPase/capsular polysaccharide biosynthesis protein
MEPPARDVGLGEYLAPLVARRWLILAALVLATAATYAYYERQPKVYEAATKLYVAQEANPVVGATAGFSDDRTVENQATLLTSVDVASTVAKRIGYRGAPAALAGSVSAVPSSGSDFITISARAATPQRAAAVANGFAQAFIDLRSARRRGQIDKAIAELDRQLRRIPSTAATSSERADVSSNIRQLEVARSSAPGNATQIDLAGPPATPIAPRPVRNAVFAFALALIGSVFLAYFLERFDPRLRKVDEAAFIYRRPVLTSVVHDNDIEYFASGVPAVSPTSREAFRQLRVNLHLAGLERPLRTILVTSASTGEGKSTVVRNLALTLHEAGRRVALVDADLRKPTLEGLLGAAPDGGMTDVLAGDRQLRDVLVEVQVESRGVAALGRMSPAHPSHGGAPDSLAILPAGPQPANPPAVLESPATAALLREVAELHDVVIIDTPPLLEVSDAIPLLGQVDAVVLVARAGVTERRSARRAMEIISRVPGVNFVGVVANDLKGLEASAYGGGEGYGYGYREDAVEDDAAVPAAVGTPDAAARTS